MILALRRRHRRMFAVIGILLPVIFVAGVAARKPIPPEPRNPLASSWALQWDRLDLFSNKAVRVEFFREASSTPSRAIRISLSKGFVKADLLVYWLPAESTIKGTIPDDAVFLGALVAGELLEVAPALAAKTGSLVLYSLADQEIVNISKQHSLR